MSFHREEIQPGKQGFSLKPQDQKVAVCELTIQKDLVGGRETLSQTAVVNQGDKDH